MASKKNKRKKKQSTIKTKRFPSVEYTTHIQGGALYVTLYTNDTLITVKLGKKYVSKYQEFLAKAFVQGKIVSRGESRRAYNGD